MPARHMDAPDGLAISSVVLVNKEQMGGNCSVSEMWWLQ